MASETTANRGTVRIIEADARRLPPLVEDRTDTKRALVAHQPDGELYLVEYCSLWREEAVEVMAGYATRDPGEGVERDATYTIHESEIAGTRIFAVCGPLERRELLGDDQQLAPSATLFDRIDGWEGDFTGEGAEWMQAEEDAGRLGYPIGVR